MLKERRLYGCLHVCLHYKRSPVGDMKSGPGKDLGETVEEAQRPHASLASGLAPSYSHVTSASSLLSPSLGITPLQDSSTLHLYLLLSVTAVPRIGGGGAQGERALRPQKALPVMPGVSQAVSLPLPFPFPLFLPCVLFLSSSPAPRTRKYFCAFPNVFACVKAGLHHLEM